MWWLFILMWCLCVHTHTYAQATGDVDMILISEYLLEWKRMIVVYSVLPPTESLYWSATRKKGKNLVTIATNGNTIQAFTCDVRLWFSDSNTHPSLLSPLGPFSFSLCPLLPTVCSSPVATSFHSSPCPFMPPSPSNRAFTTIQLSCSQRQALIREPSQGGHTIMRHQYILFLNFDLTREVLLSLFSHIWLVSNVLYTLFLIIQFP